MKWHAPCAIMAYPTPYFLYRYPNANPAPPFNRKHLKMITGVNAVAATVYGRCPAAKSNADKIFAITKTKVGISFLFL